MTRALVAFVVVIAVVIGGATSSAADETHGAGARVAHIARALAAVRQTPPATLRQESDYARVLFRGACASSVERLITSA